MGLAAATDHSWLCTASPACCKSAHGVAGGPDFYMYCRACVLQATRPWRRPCVERWWTWQQWWWPCRHPQQQGQLAAAFPSTQHPGSRPLSSSSNSSYCCLTQHPCGITTATLSIRRVAVGACCYSAAVKPAGCSPPCYVFPLARHVSHESRPCTSAPCLFSCLQALCNLPYQFAPRLQQLVHRNVNFINPATRVRRAGQECLVAMVGGGEASVCCLDAAARRRVCS